jgi:hypothetical protein
MTDYKMQENRNILNNPIRMVCLACLFFFLYACRDNQDETAPPIQNTNTPTHTSAPPTVYTPPSPTSSPIPTNTIIPPTPRPTTAMLPEEVNEFVLELLLTNNGCRLPCFWGINPGETSWNEVVNFLTPLAYNIYPPTSDREKGFVHILLDENINFEELIDLDFHVKNGIVIDIGTDTGLVHPYELSEFLKTHGIPSEIHIETGMSGMSLEDYKFRLYLYYPDLGILAIYRTPTIVTDDIVFGCPDNVSSPGLILWKPDKEQSFMFWVQNGLQFGHPDNNIKQHPHLEDATGMSVEDFFETYIDPESEACFEVPRELFEYQW